MQQQRPAPPSSSTAAPASSYLWSHTPVEIDVEDPDDDEAYNLKAFKHASRLTVEMEEKLLLLHRRDEAVAALARAQQCKHCGSCDPLRQCHSIDGKYFLFSRPFLQFAPPNSRRWHCYHMLTRLHQAVAATGGQQQQQGDKGDNTKKISDICMMALRKALQRALEHGYQSLDASAPDSVETRVRSVIAEYTDAYRSCPAIVDMTLVFLDEELTPDRVTGSDEAALLCTDAEFAVGILSTKSEVCLRSIYRVYLRALRTFRIYGLGIAATVQRALNEEKVLLRMMEGGKEDECRKVGHTRLIGTVEARTEHLKTLGWLWTEAFWRTKVDADYEEACGRSSRLKREREEEEFRGKPREERMRRCAEYMEKSGRLDEAEMLRHGPGFSGDLLHATFAEDAGDKQYRFYLARLERSLVQGAGLLQPVTPVSNLPLAMLMRRPVMHAEKLPFSSKFAFFVTMDVCNRTGMCGACGFCRHLGFVQGRLRFDCGDDDLGGDADDGLPTAEPPSAGARRSFGPAVNLSRAKDPGAKMRYFLGRYGPLFIDYVAREVMLTVRDWGGDVCIRTTQLTEHLYLMRNAWVRQLWGMFTIDGCAGTNIPRIGEA